MKNQWASLQEKHSSSINKSEQSHDYRHFYSALKRSVNFYLNKLESFLLKDAWCNVWSSGSGEDLLTLFYLFFLFRYQLLLEQYMSFYLNSLHSRMMSAKCGWNWPNCSDEENRGNISTIFPWKRAWMKFQQNWIPFTLMMPFAKFCWN